METGFERGLEWFLGTGGEARPGGVDLCASGQPAATGCSDPLVAARASLLRGSGALQALPH